MPPYLLLSSLIGAIYGALFHIWRGQSLRDLAIYLLTGVIGFFLGQGLGNLIGFDFGLVGQLHLLETSIVSWLLLLLIYWLKL